MRLIAGLLVALALSAADYHIGPGQTYTNITDAPWHTATAGDTFYIHYRETPYYEKFLVSGAGTAISPIRVLGVLGAGGERPIIDGTSAISGSNYWSGSSVAYAYEKDSIVNVGTRAKSAGTRWTGATSFIGQSSYIEIKNLEIRNAADGGAFTDSQGNANTYSVAAACINVHMTDHATLENNVLHGCGNGIFAAPNGYGNIVDIQIKNNWLYSNGRVSNWLRHQSYVEGNGCLYEGNFYDTMTTGTFGGQLKDRCAGTVIRYNRIREGARSLDLVAAESDAYGAATRALPSYLQTFVYGNIFDWRTSSMSNAIHYGDDNTNANARSALGGTLYFYDNTIVVQRQASEGRISIFDLGDSGQVDTCHNVCMIDVRNNIIANVTKAGGTGLAELNISRLGTERYTFGANWISPGYRWTQATAAIPPANVTWAGEFISPAGNSAGFQGTAAFDYHLAASASTVGMAGPLPAAATSNTLGLDLTPTLEYLATASTTDRSGTQDLGAYGFDPTIPNISTASLPSGMATFAYSQQLSGINGTAPYAYTLDSGAWPTGVSMTSGGLISGTPSVAGTFSVTVRITDSLDATSTAQFALTIEAYDPSPVITTASLSNGMVLVAYNQSVAATGGTAPYTWSVVSGALPTGLSLAAGGAITGTPLANGTFNFTVRCTDNAANTRDKALTIIVDPSNVLVVTWPNQTPTPATAYWSAYPTASGGTAPYTWDWSDNGTFVAGCSASWVTSVRLQYNCPEGTYTATFRVTDANSQTATKVITFYAGTAPPALTVLTSSLPSAGRGRSYSQILTANYGTAPYTWTVSAGALPEGLTMTLGGTIIGTPTTIGSSTFTARVADDAAAVATKELTIGVLGQPTKVEGVGLVGVSIQ